MKIFWLCLLGLLSHQAYGQEIEARAYSNAPIGFNFLTDRIAHANSGSYHLTSESLNFTRVIDVAGQSGRVSVLLPYSELSTTKNLGLQNPNASAEGLSDPVIKFSANLYGAPALSEEEFKLYKQDLIIGASVAASIPWGKYNNEQIVNVGGNRSLLKPGIGASQAIGRLALRACRNGDDLY